MLWRCLPPFFSKDRTNIFLQNVGTCILFHLMSLFWSVLFRKTVNCHDYLALVTEKWMLPEHWWHHSDRELTCDWTQASVVRCQQLTTSAMALSTQSHNPKDHNTNLHLWEISKYDIPLEEYMRVTCTFRHSIWWFWSMQLKASSWQHNNSLAQCFFPYRETFFQQDILSHSYSVTAVSQWWQYTAVSKVTHHRWTQGWSPQTDRNFFVFP
jgi:hypothetical protein